MKSWSLVFVSGLVIPIMGACAAGHDYERLEVAVPAAFAADTPVDSVAVPATTNAPVVDAWWTTFDDPQLNTLTDRAVKNNLDVTVAEERVRQARGQRRIAKADFFPQLNLSGRFTHAKNSVNGFAASSTQTGGGTGTGTGTTGGTTGTTIAGLSGTPYDLWQAGFDANWEIDFFGRIRRNTEAAAADIRLYEENRNAMLLSVTADVARNYIELRAYQRQIQIAQDNYAVQERSVAIAKTRFDAGLTTELDVAQAESQAADTNARIPSLVAAARARVHQISTLLGEEPLALAAELDAPKPIPVGLTTIPVGVPADVLQRRPDVRQAEHALHAATARTGAATAALYPKVLIAGQAGLQSRHLDNFPEEDSTYYNVGPQLAWPVFDGGRIRGQIQVQDAIEGQSRAQFRSVVLNALRDVQDALVALANERSRRDSLLASVQAGEKALRISNEQYTQGLITFINVIEAQNTLFTAQNALAGCDQQIAVDQVQLYQALGGGWEVKLEVRTGGKE